MRAIVLSIVAILFAAAASAPGAMVPVPPGTAELGAVVLSDHQVELQWKAPLEDYDDSRSGAVASYLIAYWEPIPDEIGPRPGPEYGLAEGIDSSLDLVDDLDGLVEETRDLLQSFPAGAIPVPNIPVPAAPETFQSLIVSGLPPGSSWTFGLQAVDHQGLKSGISTVTATTLADQVAPAAVELIVLPSLPSTFHVSWAAPQDEEGVPVVSIDLKYSTSPITGVDSFAAATPVPGAPVEPVLPGEAQQAALVGVLPGVHYYFALRSVDNGGNEGYSHGSGIIEVEEAGTVSEPGSSGSCGGVATPTAAMAALVVLALGFGRNR